MLNLTELKRFNMKDLLERWYGLNFQRKGHGYLCLSPFTNERKASFVINNVGGQWLFKDFSSGLGGSIIDFVLQKEGFGTVSEAVAHIRKLVSDISHGISAIKQSSVSVSKSSDSSGYDINHLYLQLKKNDIGVCRDYLAGRGIDSEVITDVIDRGMVLHNRYKDQSWCCFAVFDRHGSLCCLDNHSISTSDKFVLGKKSIFTVDWAAFDEAQPVFVCEGIIDYLSMKTLEGNDFAGVALLGNVFLFGPELLKKAPLILSALDQDEGGLSALLDLHDLYPDKKISVYDMGSCRDPNEYLQSVHAGKATSRLDAIDKLSLYREYSRASNKREVALRWGISRSYMYELIRDCEKLLLNGLRSRKPGRRKKGAPTTLEEALERINQLEAERDHEMREKERYYVRSEFLNLHLKWSEREKEELRGGAARKSKKRQLKKKKKKRS
jgi:DNA primase